MKLLTTIAAVLISISAFSQDYVEYNEGTFTQNGEELSMEQVKDLIVLHKAGRGNVRRGINFDEMHKNPYLRGGNNTLNLVGGAGGTFVGGYIGLVGLLLTISGWSSTSIESVPAYCCSYNSCGQQPVSVHSLVLEHFQGLLYQKIGCLPRRDRAIQ
jgi:hypothetical protein